MGWIGIEIFLNFNPIQPKFQKIRTQPNPSTHKKTNQALVWTKFIKLLDLMNVHIKEEQIKEL